MKRDKYDKAFSDLVRARDFWTCQKCGREFLTHERGGLDCSHFIPRGKKVTRWLPLNACAQCFGCHSYFGHNPLEFHKWMLERLGPANYEVLMDTKKLVAKWTPDKKAKLYNEMKTELKRLKLAEAGHGDFFHIDLPTAEAEAQINGEALRAGSLRGL